MSDGFSLPDGTAVKITIGYTQTVVGKNAGVFFPEEQNLLHVLAEMLRVFLTKKYSLDALGTAEHNLQAIFSCAHTGYVLTDADFKVVAFNDTMRDYLLRSQPFALETGQPISRYFTPGNLHMREPILEKVKAGEQVDLELKYRKEDTEDDWFSIRFIPVAQDDGRYALILEAMDITRQKNAQDKIRHQLDTLQRLSFMTSHELRHEYAKLYSIVLMLNNLEEITEEDKQLLKESENIFLKMDTIINKMNHTLTFGQVQQVNQLPEAQPVSQQVILVDDDKLTNIIHARMLQDHIPKERIQAFSAVDEALDYLKQHDTSGNFLVLLDLNMPGKNGWDFLDLYSQFEICSPVIILTSSIDSADIKKARHYLAVKKFISKPLNNAALEQIKLAGLL